MVVVAGRGGVVVVVVVVVMVVVVTGCFLALCRWTGLVLGVVVGTGGAEVLVVVDDEVWRPGLLPVVLGRGTVGDVVDVVSGTDVVVNGGTGGGTGVDEVVVEVVLELVLGRLDEGTDVGVVPAVVVVVVVVVVVGAGTVVEVVGALTVVLVGSVVVVATGSVVAGPVGAVVVVAGAGGLSSALATDGPSTESVTTPAKLAALMPSASKGEVALAHLLFGDRYSTW